LSFPAITGINNVVFLEATRGIVPMNVLATIGIRILEVLFVVGVLGSLAVFLAATVEDVEVILDKDVSPEIHLE
jgi:hypothetical protein